MQSLHLLSQVLPPPNTIHFSQNMSSTTDTPICAEFTASTITLIDPPTVPLPCTPTPEPIHTPNECPHLTIAPNSNTEEGEIVSRIHHHNYLLSPQSSLNVMQGHLELDAGTLCTITVSLANTAISHTFQHLKARSEIEQLRKELTDLRAQMSHKPDAECPEGFEENYGRLPDFTIPDANSIMQQARYVKLGNGPVPFTLSTLGQDNNPVYQYDLFTAPLYIRNTPTKPLPMWLIDAISGKSSSYHQAMELACSTDNWGLVAKLARYHKSDTRVLNITAKIHALDCELQVVKVASHQSRSRLKGAHAQHRLWALQALDTHRPTYTNTHAMGLCFGCGRPSSLDGE